MRFQVKHRMNLIDQWVSSSLGTNYSASSDFEKTIHFYKPLSINDSEHTSIQQPQNNGVTKDSNNMNIAALIQIYKSFANWLIFSIFINADMTWEIINIKPNIQYPLTLVIILFNVIWNLPITVLIAPSKCKFFLIKSPEYKLEISSFPIWCGR